MNTYHAIFTTYGYALPPGYGDSWLDAVRFFEKIRYSGAPRRPGDAVAATEAWPHDFGQQMRIPFALKHPFVQLTGVQARAVARGFKQAIDDAGYVVYACAILPDHVHLVVGCGEQRIERVVGHFKARASRTLRAEGEHPMLRFERPDGTIPSVWAHAPGWRIPIRGAAELSQAITFTLNTPAREGMRYQRWWFCTPLKTVACIA